jgi:DNA-binding NarL/FixJ family response regulator
MGYLHLELGDARRALEWDLRAYQASLRGNFEMRRYSLLNMATDYLHLGELEQAWETIARFEGVQEHAEYIRFRYYNRYLLLLSELYLVEKNHPRSIELAQEARQMAQSSGIPKNVAKSLWFEGQSLAGAGSTGEAIEKLDRAVTLADSIEHGSLRWKIRLSLAEALLQSGSSAVPVIQAARQLVERTAHSLAGSPLQEPLLTSAWIGQLERLEQAPATGKPAYPAGLTEREIQVLRLVASGATNQRVAEHLVISVRTVNTHMTSILKKTGCENRTAASAWAIQHNLVSK